MVPAFNLTGFDSYDPLDNVSSSQRYFLHIIVTAILSTILLYVVFYALDIASLKYNWLFWVEICAMSFFYAPIVVFLRKSSSVLILLLLIVPGFLIDFYIEANFRQAGIQGLWDYNTNALLGPLSPLLRMFVVWFIDAIFIGTFCLWVSRLLAPVLFKEQNPDLKNYNKQYKELFRKEWTEETSEKPTYDFSYWVLRLLGLFYLFYFVLLLVAILGISPFPEPIRQFLRMSYENPALTVNTFIKITLMVVLCFIGAYNKKLRFHTALAIMVGHLMSVISSLFYYFYDAPGTEYREYLLMSAIVDAILVIALMIIMIQYKKYADEFKIIKEFPYFYSIPNRLTKLFYYIFGVTIALIVLGIFGIRLFVSPGSGWGAVYGFPDPQVANTLTKYTTISFLAFLIAEREGLRQHLYKAILAGYSMSVITSGIWLLFGGMFSDVIIHTRNGLITTEDWYFMLNVLMDGSVVILLLVIRKMFYNVEYNINSISPSSAQNVVALHNAIFKGDEDDGSNIVTTIDRHVAGVRGRKRGLLNFPFWFVENVMNIIYGLRPSFSTMDYENRNFFLRKYLLRPPDERAKSFIPLLADQLYKIGNAVHALITIAHFTQLKSKEKIGYVAPDARDRLQGDYPAYPPPFQNIASLPKCPEDAENNKPLNKSTVPLIASRMVTPVREDPIPDEVDYIILGSGVGGAVMTYRLAATVNDPSKILLVERGPRYSPLQDFNDDEMEMIRKLYKEGGIQQTKRFDLMVLQGECLGGTTVINNAVCFPMPEFIKSLWQQEYDIDLSNLQNEYNQIAKEIEISEIAEDGINQCVKEKFLKGVDGFNSLLGEQNKLRLDNLKANHRNILGSGLCNIGNKRMRKRSMLETYIPWSEARGVKVVSGNSGVRFLYSGNRATHVLLRSNIGTLKKVKVNKAIVVACGVIASSHFLMRSGVNGSVGKGMSCNFAFPVAFQFPDELKAFDGVQITLGALDPLNRAVFETYFNPPGAFAISIPFYFNRLNEVMNNYTRLVNFGGLVGSEPNGNVELKADILDGRAFDWELGNKDKENIKFALSSLLEIGYAAGAQKSVLPTEPGLELVLDKINLDIFKKRFIDFPLNMNNLRLTTAHPQGGNRLSGNKSPHKNIRVVNEDFKLENFDNVFVADASVFPTGITINPQWTIMALSSMASKKVLEL